MRVEQDVMAVLSAASFEGNALRLAGQLDRNLYVRANKVLEAAGGKWNRKAKAHLFESDAEERIGQIILTGSVVVPKDEYDFFESTPAVVERIISFGLPLPGMRVLEPSAGLGAIALPAYEITRVPVDCIEKMDGNVAALRAHSVKLRVIAHADFLAVEPTPKYDRVLMNPPFSKRQDIKHVRHAFEFLKPGGRLVSVMSAGVLFREDRLAREFRDWVYWHGSSGFAELPQGAFKESGTMVRTCLVWIDKQ